MHKKDAGKLKKLTVVIISFERHRYLLRSMKYWSSISVNWIALDGSKNSLSEKLLNLNGFAENYFHLPQSVFSRINYALKYLKTEYVILAGDDEFYLASSLTNCVEFLDLNSDTVACSGRTLGFSVRDGTVYGQTLYKDLSQLMSVPDDPIERASYRMRFYQPITIYSVCRSDSWKTVWSIITSKEFNVYSIPEIQFELYMAFFGKNKIIEDLMWLRSLDENVPIRHNEIWLENKPFEDWWMGEKERDNKKHLLALSKKAFVIAQPKSKNIKLDTFQYLFDCYCEKTIEKKTFKNLVKKLSLTLAKARIKSGFNKNVPSISLNDLVKKYEIEGINVNYDELVKVTKIIQDFHEIKNACSKNDT